MLLAFGPLRTYNLVTDKMSGVSRGYAFCEYASTEVTEMALQVRGVCGWACVC